MLLCHFELIYLTEKEIKLVLRLRSAELSKSNRTAHDTIFIPLSLHKDHSN